ncbi:MAG: helix-turn-helix transcriptional regulator [Dehalococcoidales bacterium]
MESRQNQPGRNAKDRHYLKQIGENVKVARKKIGYSQEEVAEIAGFSRSYYTEIETGKRNISILNLIKIIEALKVAPNEIIGSLKPK